MESDDGWREDGQQEGGRNLWSVRDGTGARPRSLSELRCAPRVLTGERGVCESEGCGDRMCDSG